MVSKVFAKKDSLQVETLLNMRNQLFKEILHCEFHSFNLVKSGSETCISNESFAKSIIAFLSHDKASSYIKQLEKINLPEGLVSLNEYQSFHNFINFQKNVITQEIELNGAVTYRKLKKLISDLAEKDKSLSISKLQMETFMKLIDMNQNGLIDAQEFVGIVETRKYFNNQESKSKVANIFDDIPVRLQIWKNKAMKILDILQE